MARYNKEKMSEEERISKIELLKRLISLKNELNRYEQSSARERRKIKIDIDRKTEEIKALVAGNKDDIDNLWRRDDDHTEELKEMQNIIKWVEKTSLGVLITIILGFIIKSSLGL